MKRQIVLLYLTVLSALFALPVMLSYRHPDNTAAQAQMDATRQPDQPPHDISNISGDPNRPRRHFRIRDGATLTDDDARSVYAGLGPVMVEGYALSASAVATAYRQWRQFNTVPYESAAHGRRYINVFGNGPALDYGAFESAGPLPEGAILAKDSFTMTRDGEPLPGPLFVMEKMAPGFSHVSGDWRYTMIMPDGSVFGTTGGAGAQRVEFCIGCHLAREATDHLFFVRPRYRADQ